MADANELLDNLRHNTSRALDGIRRGHGVSPLEVERLCKWFVDLDMAIMEGKIPDSWSGAKLSKSDHA